MRRDRLTKAPAQRSRALERRHNQDVISSDPQRYESVIMKPSVSALAGVVLVTSGWVSVPAVAFPQHDHAMAPRAFTAASGTYAHSTTAQDGGATCHANSSACGCAICSAARDGRAAPPR
jgi:hypothetical protein